MAGCVNFFNWTDDRQIFMLHIASVTIIIYIYIYTYIRSYHNQWINTLLMLNALMMANQHIDTGNDWVPLGNKPLRTWASVEPDLYGHMASFGHCYLQLLWLIEGIFPLQTFAVVLREHSDHQCSNHFSWIIPADFQGPQQGHQPDVPLPTMWRVSGRLQPSWEGSRRAQATVAGHWAQQPGRTWPCPHRGQKKDMS